MDIQVAENCAELKLKACIGMNGKVPNSFHTTPCGNYIIYPMGQCIVVKNHRDGYAFIQEHSGEVSCCAISKDGTLLASGQRNEMGIKAPIIVCDLMQLIENCEMGRPSASTEELVKFRFNQHVGSVQAIDFSYDNQYLVSVGGKDDNYIVVWNIQGGYPLFMSPAGYDTCLTLRFLNHRNDRFVSAGNFHLRVWEFHPNHSKMHPIDAKMGKVRRCIQSISVWDDDQYAYCGTSTGDLLKFSINRDPLKDFNSADKTVPVNLGFSSERYSKGIKAIKAVYNEETGNTNCILGSGDGTICIINQSMNEVFGRKTEVAGEVTSITTSKDDKNGFYVATSDSNWYYITYDMKVELKGTCHYDKITDICFPRGCTDLFITASVNDVRIWNFNKRQELLRIQVPNLECHCVGITSSGSTVVTGWSDGKVRGFYPQSGKLKFVISDAHQNGVTALAVSEDDDLTPPWRLCTGGKDGRVRMWDISNTHQTMVMSVKEHRGPINAMKINRDSTQCISASSDGSCIVWNLESQVRIIAMFDTSEFYSCIYHPDESQFLTCGSSGRINYWDAYDGSAIRVISGSSDGKLMSLCESYDGSCFVSGGYDKTVRVWNYDDSVVLAEGRGHSGCISTVQISPDQRHIVSVGLAGGIFLWEMPSNAPIFEKKDTTTSDDQNINLSQDD